MRKFLKQRIRLLEIAANLAALTCTAIYVNLLTSGMEESTLKGFRESLSQLGRWNFLAVFALVLALAQPHIERLLVSVNPDIKSGIQAMLEATSRALIHDHPQRDSMTVRAFCHRAETGNLVPLCAWTQNYDFEDQDLEVPLDCNGFVICRAFLGRHIRHDDDRETLPDLPPELRKRVWPDINAVLAAPIRDPSDPACEPLGTVAIDSSLGIAELGFDRIEARTILQTLAFAVYCLLKRR